MADKNTENKSIVSIQMPSEQITGYPLCHVDAQPAELTMELNVLYVWFTQDAKTSDTVVQYQTATMSNPGQVLFAELENLSNEGLEEALKRLIRESTPMQILDFEKISVIGDGNCALNAFALGLIDVILRNEQDKLNQDTVRQLIQKSAAHRETLQNHPALTYPYLLSIFLQKYVEFICQNPIPEPDDFFKFIKAMQYSLEATVLSLALAPELREMGVAELENSPHQQKAAQMLKKNGAWTGDELHDPLNRLFNIKAHIVTQNGQAIQTVISNSEATDAAEIALLFSSHHWTYLEAQDDREAGLNGLAELPALDENKQVLLNLLQNFCLTLAKKAEHDYQYVALHEHALELYKASAKLFYCNDGSLPELQNQCESFTKKSEQHRGWWHQIDLQWRKIVGVLATITIVPALIVAVKSESGYWGTFFKKKEDVKTASALELEKVQSQLTLILPKQSEGTC